MTKSFVEVEVRNGKDKELVKLVAAVLIDPVSGLPTAPGGGGGSGPSNCIDFELLVIQDANGVVGIRREITKGDLIVVEYETLAGAPWVPVEPVTLVQPSLPDNAATAANQVAANNAFGQQSDAAAGNDSGAFSLMAYIKRISSMIVFLRAQLPASLGPKTSALSLSVAPSTDANLSRETYTTVTVLSVLTQATGANWATFNSTTCSSLDIVNNSGVDIEYRRNGGGNSMVVRDGYSRLIQGITNASQIIVRRVDQANTVVTVTAEAYNV